MLKRHRLCHQMLDFSEAATGHPVARYPAWQTNSLLLKMAIYSWFTQLENGDFPYLCKRLPEYTNSKPAGPFLWPVKKWLLLWRSKRSFRECLATQLFQVFHLSTHRSGVGFTKWSISFGCIFHYTRVCMCIRMHTNRHKVVGCIYFHIIVWLVVWNILYFSIYWEQ